MQVVVEFDIDVETGGGFLQALHTFTGTMAMHPFAMTIIRDDCIVTYGTLLGQNRTIGGFPRVNLCHIACDDMIDNPGRIRAAQENLLQRRHVEHAGSFADRIVFVGDCAETRLYKDGIGAAYRTAKAAARTAVFDGISAAAFETNYAPLLAEIRKDNRVGEFTFAVTRIIQRLSFARRAVVRMVAREQHRAGERRRMSGVLWDMFTGSASYTSVFWRTLHPAFVLQLLWNLGCSLVPGRRPTHG